MTSPRKCKEFRSSNSKFELISGFFQSIPPIFIIELGHLTNITIRAEDIEQFIFITNSSKHLLCYKLAGYTLSAGKINGA